MDNEFNLDDILREFSDDAPSRPEPGREPEVRREPEARREPVRAAAQPVRRAPEQPEQRQPAPSRERRAEPEKAPSAPRKVREADVRRSAEPRRAAPEAKPEMPREEQPRRKRSVSPVLRILYALVFFAVIAAVGFWMVKNIHPNSATVKTVSERQQANLSARFDALANNLASDALSDVVYIKKVYTVPEDASVAYKPTVTGFGTTDDPAVIQDIIDGASELLGGQSTVWNSGIAFYDNDPTISYYYDDTILSIVWKEVVGNTVFTFAEVKIADGSQLRRTLAGDAYSSSIQLKASDMAKTVNAVTAINGDFYAFRPQGIVVYKRNLERFSPGALDSCFYTSGGDMLFAHAGELSDEEAVRQYVKDNDILFSTSFGPILVEDGEIYPTPDYPIGEINTYYARSAIGMTGELHYLLLATSSEKDARYLPGIHVSTAAEIMHDRGCIKAYELDGGQTAVIVHGGEPANEIVYGSERTMSDIIYFATAIPEEEAGA